MALTLNGDDGIAGVDGSAATPAIQGTDSNTGISFGTDTVNVVTGGSTRTTVDSSGRLLVGTSSSRAIGTSSGFPARLQVESTGFTLASFTQNSNDVFGPELNFGKSRGTSTGSNTIVQNGDALGQIQFAGADGTDLATNAAAIEAFVDGTPGSNDMPGRLVFSTTADGASSPTERMRLTSDGYMRLGDGTTYYHTIRGGGGNNSLDFTANAGQQNAGSVGIIRFLTSSYGGAITERMRITSSGRLRVNLADFGSDVGTSNRGFEVNENGIILTSQPSTATQSHHLFYNPNGNVGSIQTNGSSTSFNTSSDYRLKENVVPVTDGITRLQQLNPARFNFIADPNKTVDGFLAHEVQDVVPEAISGEKDAVDDEGNPVYQGIDQSKLVPLLTAALQEAVQRIETLETANASQAATIAAFEARLTALEGGAA